MSDWSRGTRGQGGSGKHVVCRVLAVERYPQRRCQGECRSLSSVYRQCLNLIITLSLSYVQHFWPASFRDRFWCYSNFTVHNYREYAFVLLSYFPLPLVTDAHLGDRGGATLGHEVGHFLTNDSHSHQN